MSTWSSRFGSLMSGRFSPFGRPGYSSNPDNKVTDADYSYITSEDLDEHTRQQSQNSDTHRSSGSASHHAPPLSHKDRPPRDTDSLVFRHNKTSYTVHFPAYNIDDGILTIAHAREHAARKLGAHDPRRIHMSWRGRNLKDDSRTCRDEGMRSADDGSDILCVVGAESPDPDSEDDSVGSVDGGAAAGTADARLARNRRKREKRKASRRGDSNSSSATASPIPPIQQAQRAPQVEHLPMPSGAHPSHHSSHLRQPSPQPPRAGSRQPSPQPAPQPTTPMGKLDAIRANFETTLMPPAADLVERPPRDIAKRDFEHKRLTETILTQVLMKLDGVETEGDEEARGRRKQLVKDAQEWLRRLDTAVGKKGASG